MTIKELYKAHCSEKATVKYEHYLDIYDQYFPRFKDRKITVVEVGVGGGGSLEVWSKYFGDMATVYGIDATGKSYLSFDGNVKCVLGNQSDRGFWQSFLNTIGPIDIFIDDGGHIPEEQIITFEEVFPSISQDGLYICEDIHDNYQDDDAFHRYCRNLVDQVNAWAYETDSKKISYYAHNLKSICFYTFLIVIEKKNMDLDLHSPLFRGGQHVHP